MATWRGTPSTDSYSYGTADNRLMSISGGTSRSFTYDAAGNVTFDNSTGAAYGYVAANRMASFSISGLVQAEYGYDPYGRQIIRRLIQDQKTIQSVYDIDGNRIAEYEIDDLTGASTLLREYVWMSYSPDGQFASRTDENGNPTAFTFDATGNLATITYSDSSVTSMGYDASGNTIAIAEATGSAIERQVHRTYDAMNRVVTVEVAGADGVQIDGLTSYSYLPAGNLETVTDETGLVTTMSYDGLERLVALDDPAEGLIQRVYNEAGEVIQHINGDGEIHSYGYDAVGRLTATTDPMGYDKAIAYDLRDGVTAFGYDPLDRMMLCTNPLSLSMARAYDARDNLLTLTREDGVVETAGYDGLSRRTQVVTPDNTLTYAYDARGKLTEAADADSRVTFGYDTRNRLGSTTTDGTVGPQPGVTLSYSYDALDRRLTMSDSLGGTTAYDWDVENRLATLTAPWGTVYSFGYDGEGRRTALTSTTGRATSYGYTNGLLTALTHIQSGTTLTDLVYEYGPDGQLTAILDQLDPSSSKFISYDALNRLIGHTDGTTTASYAYDALERRIVKVVDRVATA